MATWDSFSVFLMCHPLSIFVFVNKAGEEKRERREKEGTEGEEEKRGEEEVGTQQGGEGRTREERKQVFGSKRAEWESTCFMYTVQIMDL